MKKIIILILIGLILIQPISYAYDYEKLQEETNAFLVAELQTGKIIIQNNIEEPVSIASLSKVMTYLLIKEKLRDDSNLNENTLFTIPKEAVDYNEASAHLDEGDQVTIENLLEALMIVSGNDAAQALAIFHSGSVENFAKAMNQRAKDLGLTTAHFINASGLTLGEDYNKISLFDYLTLVRYTLRSFPEIRTYSQKEYYIDDQRDFKRFNYALFVTDRINQADWIKTGYTEVAGYSAVIGGRFKYNVPTENYEFIAIMTGSENADKRVEIFTDLINGVHYKYPLSRVKNMIHFRAMESEPTPWYPSKLYEFREKFFRLLEEETPETTEAEATNGL